MEPCIFGGAPDCSQCGCAISTGLHWLKEKKLAGLVKIETIALASAGIGALAGRIRHHSHPRWKTKSADGLVQIRGAADSNVHRRPS